MQDYTCPACASTDWTFLGALGRRDNFRCRDCGIDFSCVNPDPPEEPFEEDCDGTDLLQTV